jgi:hypothetical protein
MTISLLPCGFRIKQRIIIEDDLQLQNQQDTVDNHNSILKK